MLVSRPLDSLAWSVAAGRRSALLLGGATLALLAGASPVRAQCAPDPLIAAGGTIVCAGADTDGLVIVQPLTSVQVAAGAVVSGGARGAITVGGDVFGTRLLVEGVLDGGPEAGIQVNRNSTLQVFIGPRGRVTGEVGLRGDSAGRNRVDNAGTIAGTSGPAIDIGFDSSDEPRLLRNREGALISGGVRGGFGSIENEGGIAGGERAGIEGDVTIGGLRQQLDNRGRIESAATAVAMAGEIDNRGTITVTGNQPTVVGGASLTLRNRAGGMIRAGSVTAVSGGERLVLDNAGTLTGDVRGGTSASRLVQRTGGVLQGAYLGGDGRDELLIEARGDVVPESGIMGSIEGGAGDDSFGYLFTGSGSIAFPDLPSGFERYLVELCGCDIDLTVNGRADGVAYSAGLDIVGEGDVVLDASFVSTGRVLDAQGMDRDDKDGDAGLNLVSRGALTGVGSEAVRVAGEVATFRNEGTIRVTSGDDLAITSDARRFVNAGGITVEGGILASGAIENSGTIEHTGPILAEAGLINSGTISSAGGSVASNRRIVNSGVIANSSSGPAILVGGSLANAATGTVTGNVELVGEPGLRAVGNAGRINGQILGSDAPGGEFVQLAQGSFVEGVSLGEGDDVLVIDASRADQTGRTGALSLAGIVGTGGVDLGEGNDTVWFQATASREMNVLRRGEAITGLTGSEDVAYEAAGANTTLTLVGPVRDGGGGVNSIARTVNAAGDGTVVLGTDINVAALFDSQNRALRAVHVLEGSTASRVGQTVERELDLVIAASLFGSGGYDQDGVAIDAAVVDATNAKSVTQRAGSRIDAVRGVALDAGAADVLLEGGSDIRAVDVGASRAVTLVRGGGNIVNRGTIIENGTTLATGNDATGVDLLAGGSLFNERSEPGAASPFRAFIDTNGNAVRMNDATTLVNTSDIASRGKDAVEVLGAGVAIRNLGRGVLTAAAGSQAIDASEGGATALVNAARIEGDVRLSATDDLIVAVNGGAITGAVDFGAGNDTLLTRGGEATGITGNLTGGDGFDAFGRSYTTGTDNLHQLTKPGEFEMFAAEALGANTRVALTAPATVSDGVRLFGDGAIENRANIVVGDPNDTVGIEVNAGSPDAVGQLAFVNAASASVIATDRDAFRASAGLRSFENFGTFSGTGTPHAVRISSFDNEEPFQFRNQGTISATGNAGGAVRVQADEIVASNGGVVEAAGRTAAGRFDSTGAISLANSGSFRNAGTGDSLSLDSKDMASLANAAGSLISATNGTALRLRAAGAALLGLSPEDCPPGTTTEPRLVARIDNAGILRANGGGLINEGAIDAAIGAYIDLADSLGGGGELLNRAGATIEATGANSVAIVVRGATGGPAASPTQRFRLINEGTISGTGATSGAGDFADELAALNTVGQTEAAGAIQTFATSDDITNTGTLIGNVDLGTGDDIFRAGGRITGDIFFGDGDDRLVLLAGLNFSGTAYGGDGLDTLTVDLGDGATVNGSQFLGFERQAFRVGLNQTANLGGRFEADTVLLEGGTINVVAGEAFSTLGPDTVTGADTDDRINVLTGATVAGNLQLGAGDDIVSNAGAVNGAINLGAGNDRYLFRGGTAASIDGGTGIDTLDFLLTVDSTPMLNGIIGFESLAARGENRLTVTPGQDFDTIELLDGADLTLNAGTGRVTNITGDDTAQDVVLNSGVGGRISLGGGNDVLTLALAGALGEIDGGAGDDTLNATLTGGATLSGLAGFEIANFAGAAPLTLTGTIADNQHVNLDGADNSLTLTAGAQLFGIVDGGAGRDQLTLETNAPDSRTLVSAQVLNFENLLANGSGTVVLGGERYGFQSVGVNGGNLTLGVGTSLIAGQVDFDAADNTLTLAGRATVTGRIDGGEGRDTLALNQSDGNETRSLASLNVTGFERLASSGPGTLDVDTNATFEAVTLAGGTTNVVANALLEAPVTGSAGAETLVVAGLINGAVALGEGDDRLLLASAANGTGVRVGGAGVDVLEFRTSATTATPESFGAEGYAGFENLVNAAGVLRLTGTQSYQNIAVTGGRLIGAAGSTLNSAQTIIVSQGATFGSAGTVNADLDVRGTLSPGASPGTMTVNGNVAFAGGSNLLLELEPQAQDLLAISGTLTIAQGAGVDITGMLGNSPGRVLDLVVADGGITGSFTTVNKSPNVFGFVVQNANRLQLRGEFADDRNFAANARASIAYSNARLGAGQLVQPFTAALGRLTDAQGRSNELAFAQLTPEAYATASQLGLQNALAITDATRAAAIAAPTGTEGAFAFGQTIASWGRVDRQRQTTLGRGNVDSLGLLTGIGYGFADARIGVFGGFVDAEQSLGALDATTRADGWLLGAFADARFGGVGVRASVAYNQADAGTNRNLLAASGTVRGRFGLDTLVADAAIDYRLEAGGLTLQPRIGLTGVRTERGGAVETGGNGFSLSVLGRSYEALFGDAGVKLSTSASLGGMALLPYAEFGVRHRLAGDDVTASARFTGATGPALTVSGVDYGRTVARVSTGFALDVSDDLRLNATYGFEAGRTQRHALTGGVRLRF